jgi:hypothetical protein
LFGSFAQHDRLQALNNNWSKAYYLATSADALVSLFRKWLDKYGGGAPAWAPGTVTAPNLDKSGFTAQHTTRTVLSFAISIIPTAPVSTRLMHLMPSAH